eukprot:CAMPEP_0198289770 /NCGR_PEP_ID=MMETSP1449-20131203/7853_1 /TAXON_ID=420275 /ORGANISM="Attheya septentrionalis, Strain CCMP2084" /LENGTH=216 /DNA_ID=CAMNT_0043988157 /DNA_START=312 /DNA_END=962 /DNA_ORIENTATION=+
MVLIVTALVLIFTVGLEDNQDNNGVSAYSVFNRGFQRLMGSVDVEALVAQHVGGALAVPQPEWNQDDDAVAAAAPPPNPNIPRIFQPLDHGQNEGPVPPAVAGGAQQQPNGVQPPGGNPNNNNMNRSRKSGKKARRRRDLDQRRELQRQRNAAAELGFAPDQAAMLPQHQQQEMMAMNRLLDLDDNDDDDDDDDHADMDEDERFARQLQQEEFDED